MRDFDFSIYPLDKIIRVDLFENWDLTTGLDEGYVRLKPEIDEWIKANIRGRVWRREKWTCCELFFEHKEDAALFKLFHI